MDSQCVAGVLDASPPTDNRSTGSNLDYFAMVVGFDSKFSGVRSFLSVHMVIASFLHQSRRDCVDCIFLMRAPFEVFDPVVVLDAVLVVDARFGFWIRNEMVGYKEMNLCRPLFRFFPKIDLLVSLRIPLQFSEFWKFRFFGNYPSLARYLVGSRVSFYVLPNFGFHVPRIKSGIQRASRQSDPLNTAYNGDENLTL